jgi:hypothetical protein
MQRRGEDRDPCLRQKRAADSTVQGEHSTGERYVRPQEQDLVPHRIFYKC